VAVLVIDLGLNIQFHPVPKIGVNENLLKSYPLVNWHSYGKSPFSMGKSTDYKWQFSIAISNYQTVFAD
jgi:hypothetical protein